MDYYIRHCDISDYDSIINLWGRAGLPYKPQGRDSRETMAREFKRPETCFLGMYDDNNLIGIIVGTSDGRKGWLNRLAIDPDYRGQGLAGRLIKEAEDYLQMLGLKVIAALIEDINYPSITAFNKAGYICDQNILYFSKRGSTED